MKELLEINMAKSKIAKNVVNSNLIYEEKTAVLYHTMIFLSIAEEHASANVEIENALLKFSKYLEPNKLNYMQYFSGQMLLSLVSEVELYLASVLRIILATYPKKICGKTFTLSEIVENSKDELIQAAVEEFITKIMYKSPAEYLDEFCKITSINKNEIIDS